jgi:hypothetical protein
MVAAEGVQHHHQGQIVAGSVTGRVGDRVAHAPVPGL